MQKLDLDRDIFKKLIPLRQLYAYASPEYVKDMGTPKRYAQVEQDMRTGKIRMKNLHEKQKAFFLDMGTLCMLKNTGRNAGQVELCPGAIEAVRQVNDSGYLTIMVSTSRASAVNDETTFEEEERLMDKKVCRLLAYRRHWRTMLIRFLIHMFGIDIAARLLACGYRLRECMYVRL